MCPLARQTTASSSHDSFEVGYFRATCSSNASGRSSRCVQSTRTSMSSLRRISSPGRFFRRATAPPEGWWWCTGCRRPSTRRSAVVGGSGRTSGSGRASTTAGGAGGLAPDPGAGGAPGFGSSSGKRTALRVVAGLGSGRSFALPASGAPSSPGRALCCVRRIERRCGNSGRWMGATTPPSERASVSMCRAGGSEGRRMTACARPGTRPRTCCGGSLS